MIFRLRPAITPLLFVLALTVTVGATESTTNARQSVDEFWFDFQPVFTAQTCPFLTDTSQWSKDVICGYVLVPENRTQSDSRLIKLSVMKFPATGDATLAGATLRIDGGPGGPSVTADRAAYYTEYGSESLRKLGDVVFHDQRGIGYSESDFCRAVPDAYQFGVRMADEGFSRFRSTMRKCLKEAALRGIDVDAYSTWHNAHDVRDIRRALGYDQWNLVGVSYGTQLAQAVMSIDPDGVRSAVLDSVAPAAPGPEGGWGAVGYGFRSALEVIDRSCLSDLDCSEGFPKFSEVLIEVIRSYENSPLILDDLDRTRFPQGTMVLDADLAALFTFQILYDEANYGDLPVYLRVLETRNKHALSAYVNAAAWPIDHKVGQGMRLVANCRGSAPLTLEQQQTYRQLEPEFSRWLKYHDTTDTCLAAYKVSPDASATPLKTSIPILIGAGAADPVTPPRLAKQIMSGLSDATYVEFPYSGHGVFLNEGCAEEILFDFLRAPDKRVDTTCVSKLPAPNFVFDYRETSSAFSFLQKIHQGSWAWLPGLAVLGLVTMVILFTAKLVSSLRGRSQHNTAVVWLHLTSAVISLSSVISAIVLALNWMAEHPLAAPVTLPETMVISGGLAVLAVTLAIVAAFKIKMLAAPALSIRSVGAAALMLLLTGYVLVFLTLHGAGPF